jgi:hypothetical protein
MVAASVPAFATLADQWLDPGAAKRAVAAYGLALANPLLFLGSNAEAFILLPLVAALAVPNAGLAGVLLGIAVMTKPIALVFAPLLILRHGRRAHLAVLGGVTVTLIVASPFLPVWHDFWDANVTFNLNYATGGSRSWIRLLAPHPAVVLGSLPLIVLAVVGMRGHQAFMPTLLALSVISAQSTGLGFPHYYALLMPSLALYAGSGWQRFRERQLNPYYVLIPATLTLTIVGITLVAMFAATRQHSQLINAVKSEPGEFYMLGDRSQIYAQAERWPERRIFYSVPAVVRDDWGESLRANLISCPPAVLVIPARSVFKIEWHEDLTRLYRGERQFDDGTLYTDPYVVCAPDGG